MKRYHDTPALRELACRQHQVAGVAQLADVGLTPGAVRHRCGPRGPWQRVLPRVVVLHAGPLTAAQRHWAALLYAGYPAAEALVTGAAALTLHGLREIPAPSGANVVDVLVPQGCAVRTHTWVRVHHTRTVPAPDTVGGLPVAPLTRAAADGVRASCDPRWVREMLTELVAECGVTPDALTAELRPETLSRKPGLTEVLRQLQPRSRGPVPEPVRMLVRRAVARQPLWRPVLRLDGVFLASPDAYWARDGVALEVGGGPGRGRLEALGLRVLRLSLEALHRRPGDVAAALRAALSQGPHGPLDRITVQPGLLGRPGAGAAGR